MLLFALSDLWTAVILAVVGPGGALLVGWQLNRARRAEKLEDYKRQDEVAKKAEEAAKKVEEARVALVKENERRDEETARQQADIAAVAAETARLLVETQATTRADADEVARIAAEKPGAVPGRPSGRLLAVVISHPSGYRREIMLDGIPSVGQHILLRNASPSGRPSRVADVLWVEANGGNTPSVVVVVCPTEPGDDGRLAAAAVLAND